MTNSSRFLPPAVCSLSSEVPLMASAPPSPEVVAMVSSLKATYNRFVFRLTIVFHLESGLTSAEGNGADHVMPKSLLMDLNATPSVERISMVKC